jgi:serine phosphatase RsbU (regulator of sigma subunit)/DNA-binding transcriptional regulator YhcF (GntR family)
MLLNLTDLSAEPLHRQISAQLAEKIKSGELAAGAELPSVRVLATEHRVSKNTVKRAYDEMARRGLVGPGSEGTLRVANLTEEERRAISVLTPMGYESQLSAIQSLSRGLVSVFDTAKIRSLFAANIRESMKTSEIYTALPGEGTDRFILVDHGRSSEDFVIAPDDPFLAVIAGRDVPLVLPAGTGDAPASSRLLDELRTSGTRVVYPLKDRGCLLGFVALGRRAADAAYTHENLNLLAVMADQFVTALAASRLYVESLEKRQMEEELRMARELQADLLPGEWDNGGGFSLAAYTSPSRTVGGDFYDYFPIDETRVGLVIADASGKGMPAAMLISQIQAILKSGVGNGDTLVRTLASLNRHLERNTAARYFATLFYGIYDWKAGSLEFANAGHDYPILVRNEGSVETLESTGPALGVLPEFDHKTGSVTLHEGDSLLLYTDGITDAADSNGKHYGEQRLRNILVRNRSRSPREIIDLVRKDLEEFCGSGVLQDDRTLMVLRVDNANERKSDAAQSH